MAQVSPLSSRFSTFRPTQKLQIGESELRAAEDELTHSRDSVIAK